MHGAVRIIGVIITLTNAWHSPLLTLCRDIGPVHMLDDRTIRPQYSGEEVHVVPVGTVVHSTGRMPELFVVVWVPHTGITVRIRVGIRAGIKVRDQGFNQGSGECLG